MWHRVGQPTAITGRTVTFGDRRLMEGDYFAPLRLTQVVLPHMVARRSGHLSVVSSMAGKVGGPLGPAMRAGTRSSACSRRPERMTAAPRADNS